MVYGDASVLLVGPERGINVVSDGLDSLLALLRIGELALYGLGNVLKGHSIRLGLADERLRIVVVERLCAVRGKILVGRFHSLLDLLAVEPLGNVPRQEGACGHLRHAEAVHGPGQPE